MIEEDKPRFSNVKEILQISVNNTVTLLQNELKIKLKELEESWHLSSLEKIFIENRIYNDIEQCETWESVIETIDKGLEPFKKKLRRKVTRDDIIYLTEIKIKRISKYNTFKADEYIKSIEQQLEEIKHYLDNIIEFTINYYKEIKKKHGVRRERKTEIRNFDYIEATVVAANNVKLFVNRKEGFIGTGLRKDEFVCECSDIDEIIIFREDGKYLVTKVEDKQFVGKNILYAGVFKKNDERTIYNVIYRDGKYGKAMMKRFPVTGLFRDREYDLTKGSEGSKVLYFSANPNGEAEVVKVSLKPKPRLKKLVFEMDFSELDIKGKNSMGNVLTKHEVHKIVMKEKGESTLGGEDIWFDPEVLRLNKEDRGKFLGTFYNDDKILVISKSGYFKFCNYDLTNHFEDDIVVIEKYQPEKVYTAVYYDGEKNCHYIKRFTAEGNGSNQSFIGEHEKSKFEILSDEKFPQFEVLFGGKHKNKKNLTVDAAEFIGVKSYKARGKRLSTYKVRRVNELEPLEKEAPAEQLQNGEIIAKAADKDEKTGLKDVSQMKLDI